MVSCQIWGLIINPLLNALLLGYNQNMRRLRAIFTGCTFSEAEIKELKSWGVEVLSMKTDLCEDDLVSALEEADIYIMGGDDIASKRVVESAKNLKLIVFLGAGYERYVDTETARKRNIPVTYTPGANAETVAEHTVALVLDAVKEITSLNNSTKKGGWERRKAWNLKGKTLGIIGMGAIGSRVARILHRGFGMTVLYASRTEKTDLEKELGAKKVSLADLLKRSDVVSINALFSDETVGMIGENELSLMKSSAVLVNTARAELVNPKALYQALKENIIACAASDVYYTEPIPKSDKPGLLGLPDKKFIITPHTAYSSSDAIKAMNKMMMESLSDFVEGKEIRHRVTY